MPVDGEPSERFPRNPTRKDHLGKTYFKIYESRILTEHKTVDSYAPSLFKRLSQLQFL